MKRAHAMPFGAEWRADGTTRFRLWAPSATRVEVEWLVSLGRTRLPMQAVADGYHELVVSDAPPGTHYSFIVDSGLTVPDPASRRNPQDVHGPSEVVDPYGYAWRDDTWAGRPWAEAVIYELHVGTFTQAGTFTAAAERLPELAALGITAIELMPVADFPGTRNWGYDGVLLYAPDAAYGEPRDLKSFVDDAHALGMMVLLDVVYNHFGPEGNYLHAYCPQFFNPQHHTPWGAAINFDGNGNRTVRDFYIHNALYWVEEYHFDGLRLDAVHAIRDESSLHIVAEIAAALRAGPGRTRHVHLVLENDANEARFLGRDGAGMPLCATAQWNDDLHHAAHVLVSGESDGYYADYADNPLARLGRALAEGFIYQGEPSVFRDGAVRGEPSAQLPSTVFVSFLQTHDQVGNRAFGERLHALSDARRERTVLACLLLSPHIPMFFMGEEFAASTPFQFFCDFGAELAQAVTEGRRREFAHFAAFRDAGALARIPDPGDIATFRASKLLWAERETGKHRERLELVRQLLALRQRQLVPHLAGARHGGRFQNLGEFLQVTWVLDANLQLRTLANFGAAPVTIPVPPTAQVIYTEGVRPSGDAGNHFEAGAIQVSFGPVDD